MIAASSRTEFSLKRLSFFPEPALTACRAYFGGPRIRYPRRKRASVYRFIQDLAAEAATRAGKSVITPTAWRMAARQWLVKNIMIRIQKAGEVSSNFSQKNDHN